MCSRACRRRSTTWRATGSSRCWADRMRVEESISIEAPREAIWELVSDPCQYPSFMSGITRFDVAGKHVDGAGGRYMMRMHVGSAQVGGEVEIVEFDAPNDMGWTSGAGIDQRGGGRVGGEGGGTTRVKFRLGDQAPGTVF